MNKQLSLIILTYNSEKDIYDCLASVYKYNDIGDGLEIIVVDNNSANFDTMRSKLQQQYPDVIVIRNEKNGGYGQGNNVGIRASTAPIVTVMNPDVRLIMPVFGTFLQTLSAPDVAMCGGKQYANETKPNYSFYYDFQISPIRQSLFHRISHKLDKYNYKCMWLQGAFWAIKKDIFEHIGLFDENLFMYAEEYDIHLRLRKHFPQMKIIYLPHARYLHLTAFREFSEKTVQKEYESNLYVCKKHNLDVRKMLSNMRYALFYNYCIDLLRNPVQTLERKKLYQQRAALLQKSVSATTLQ